MHMLLITANMYIKEQPYDVMIWCIIINQLLKYGYGDGYRKMR